MRALILGAALIALAGLANATEINDPQDELYKKIVQFKFICIIQDKSMNKTTFRQSGQPYRGCSGGKKMIVEKDFGLENEGEHKEIDIENIRISDDIADLSIRSLCSNPAPYTKNGGAFEFRYCVNVTLPNLKEDIYMSIGGGFLFLGQRDVICNSTAPDVQAAFNNCN